MTESVSVTLAASPALRACPLTRLLSMNRERWVLLSAAAPRHGRASPPRTFRRPMALRGEPPLSPVLPSVPEMRSEDKQHAPCANAACFLPSPGVGWGAWKKAGWGAGDAEGVADGGDQDAASEAERTGNEPQQLLETATVDSAAGLRDNHCALAAFVELIYAFSAARSLSRTSATNCCRFRGNCSICSTCC